MTRLLFQILVVVAEYLQVLCAVHSAAAPGGGAAAGRETGGASQGA